MPWLAIASAAVGVAQSISAASKKRKAEHELEAMAKNSQPNQSILDYYNKALSKYSANPYQSAAYNQQENQINRNLATGLNSAQNRRLGLGAVGGLVQQADDASARAAGNAEAANRQDFSQLGQAAGMKTNEEQKKFDMLYNLKAAKAGAYASTENTGIQNIWGGLNAAGTMVSQNGGWGNGSGWDNGTNAGSVAWKMPRSRVAF